MKARKPRTAARVTGQREWVGGRVTTPFVIEGQDPADQAEAVIWFEAPELVIVGLEMVDPERTGGALGRLLQHALHRPLTGKRRRPDWIRVMDDAAADEVRAVVGGKIPVVVAPIPELELFEDSLLQFAEDTAANIGGDETFLESGAVEPATVAAMFEAAAALHHAAPWDTAGEYQLLRLDIPELEVAGAAVSIVGRVGERRGLLIFPTDDAYYTFKEALVELDDAEEIVDLGTDWLALNYERGGDLVDAMRREVATHRWPLASADAYPVVSRFDQHAVCGPFTERDLRIATAAAEALCAFFADHRDLFATEDEESEEPVDPVGILHACRDGLEVGLSWPYLPFPPPDTLSIPRGESPEGRMVHRLCAFVREHFGPPFFDAMNFIAIDDDTAQITVPWLIYMLEIEGRTVLSWYLEQHGGDLDETDRTFAAAQQEAWLSIWQVTAVEPGQNLTMHDLLTGETRRVTERTASQTLTHGDAVLARVVDHAGVSTLSGLHPRSLSPDVAAEVARLTRGRLRRRGVVPAARLQDGTIGKYLIRKWDREAARAGAERAQPPELRNTDGDPLLLTVDRFRVEPGAAREVAARLAAIDGCEPLHADTGDLSFDFTRPREAGRSHAMQTIVGHGRLRDGILRLETNSLRRADALRAQVEAACGDLVRHLLRDHSDPRAVVGQLDDFSSDDPP